MATRPGMECFVFLVRAAALATACMLVPGPAPRAAGAADEPVQLGWKLRKGEVLRYRMNADQRAEHDFGKNAAPLVTSQRYRVVWRFEVHEIDPTGVARIRCVYESVAFELDQLGLGRLAWDSEKPEDLPRAEDPAVLPFARLVGQEFNFGLAATGTVTDVHGFDKVLKAMLAGMEDNPIAVSVLKTGFGEQAVRAELEHGFAIAPERPVTAGARWSRSFEQQIPFVGRLRYETAFTFAGVEEAAGAAAARLDLAVQLESAAPPVPGPAGVTTTAAPECATPLEALLQAQAEVEFQSGAGAGRALFAIETGRLLRSEQTVEMKLRTRLLPPVAPRDGPGSAAVTASIRQTTLVELLPPAR